MLECVGLTNNGLHDAQQTVHALSRTCLFQWQLGTILREADGHTVTQSTMCYIGRHTNMIRASLRLGGKHSPTPPEKFLVESPDDHCVSAVVQ